MVLATRAVAAGTAAPPLLDDAEFDRVQAAIDRSLKQMAGTQESDGSFHANTVDVQPAMTGLCVMAFLARGHLPDVGPYGKQLSRAIDYIMECQQSNGVLAAKDSSDDERRPHTVYNHAIAGLTLAEVYGVTRAEQEPKLRVAISLAIQYSLNTQFDQQQGQDAGGWGYTPPHSQHRSDLSVVSWQIMFLRAAKNCGFDVPQEAVKYAMDYVVRRYDPQEGGFFYATEEHHRQVTRSMTGVGIVMLSLGGQHDSQPLKEGAAWLAEHPWRMGRVPSEDSDGEYTAYYCMQAAMQLGEPFWSSISSPILSQVLQRQRSDGTWLTSQYGLQYGPNYTTAMYVLALAALFELLPIYQR
ncbi:MAG: terpene cyclase/mutase family protein [Planctomycetota bacterium]|nr:terpene cyclase/mutase family protein [Planctomycetota bacterium]MDA1179412.1 terpene cyclase/mutase family protein [Planctomycetota bacterium]